MRRLIDRLSTPVLLTVAILLFATNVASQVAWVAYNIRSEAGSVSAPTHSFITDPDTGGYLVAADELGFGAGGELIASAVEGSEDYFKVVNGLDNGEQFRVRAFTGALADLSSSATASNLIPAGCWVLGLSVRVTTLVTASGGGVSIDIGDGTDGDRFGTGIAFAADTTTDNTDWTITTPAFYTSATSVVLAPDAGAFTAGAARISGFCLDIVAPTG